MTDDYRLLDTSDDVVRVLRIITEACESTPADILIALADAGLRFCEPATDRYPSVTNPSEDQ